MTLKHSLLHVAVAAASLLIGIQTATSFVFLHRTKRSMGASSWISVATNSDAAANYATQVNEAQTESFPTMPVDSSAVQIKMASTQEELEMIFRFRYSVYVEELKRNYPEADHKRKWLRDKADDSPYALNIYACGEGNRIVGAARVHIWPSGKVPEDYYNTFSMDLFPGIEDMVTSELGRLMVSPSAREGDVFPSLIRGVYNLLVERGCELCFLYCVPGLVKYYRRNLGARPYSGRLVSAGSSVGIPKVIVISDWKHLVECGATYADLSRTYFDGDGNGWNKEWLVRRPSTDVSKFSHLFEEKFSPVALDEEAVWDQFHQHLMEDESAQPTVLGSLTEEIIRKLTASGFLLELSTGDMVTKSGTEEREMYVILRGAFEVLSPCGQRLAILERGDLFGEIAFFSESGVRSATVRAMSKGEVLVLRQNFLKEITREDPDAGWQILFNMGRVMAERILTINDKLVAARNSQNNRWR